MWDRLLDLAAACRRPIVFHDFETAGLGGKPPVEYALAYWAPWCDPDTDAVSTQARLLAPPGLTYAAHGRLNPGCPIDPGAAAVHGITDADVKGAPSFRDLAITSVFRGLAVGDAASGEGPAIFAGHNVAEADVPWMREWGYLDAGAPAPAVIDTIRLFRRFAKEHPHPLHPDAVADYRVPTLESPVHCPAVRHGLRPYNATLAGMHTALFGDPHDGGHGALADVLASARGLCALLSLWAPLFPGGVKDEDPHAALDELLAALNAPPAGQLSWDGWVQVDRNTGALSWTGKAKKVGGEGTPLTKDLGFAKWVTALPSAPTGIDGLGWCSAETRAVLTGGQTALPMGPRIGHRVDMRRTP